MYFHKKKSLGQNFLKSKGVVADIISAAKIKRGDFVLEVGPGQGFLTEDLIEASGNVLSIEKDHRLIEILENKFREYIEKNEVNIGEDDILDFDINQIRGEYKLVANIPYYITGQIIKKFLTASKKPISMTLMVQKEVAERIVARDGKESVLSLSVRLFGEPKYVGTVKKEKFSPSPKVDSAVLHIQNIEQRYFQRKEQEALFFEIVKKAFNQKRKKIGNTLKQYEISLNRAEIDKNKRPENLNIEEWVSLIKEIDF